MTEHLTPHEHHRARARDEVSKVPKLPRRVPARHHARTRDAGWRLLHARAALWRRFRSIDELVSISALELYLSTTGVGLYSVGRIQRTLAKRGAFLAGDEPRVGRTA